MCFILEVAAHRTIRKNGPYMGWAMRPNYPSHLSTPRLEPGITTLSPSSGREYHHWITLFIFIFNKQTK
ncbi:hypothetical protein EUGRSUZ_K01166 [Eucalyptus grandis]|uniref:Uncharacterized protein n=2 Tax=Eucalyptus grandis TaxID=71139 RepID=A0ACC3IU75_EUCGR|nr:hypothetical protein EUGRSUZ_K01166 [Eucalyptus grandis]